MELSISITIKINNEKLKLPCWRFHDPKTAGPRAVENHHYQSKTKNRLSKLDLFLFLKLIHNILFRHKIIA